MLRTRHVLDRTSAPQSRRRAAEDTNVTSTLDTASTPGNEVAVVRQPIADARRNVIGYELLFGSAGRRLDPARDAKSTSALLVDAFGDIGLDRLAGRHPAWMSISRDFLVEIGPPSCRSPPTRRATTSSPSSSASAAAATASRWPSTTGGPTSSRCWRSVPS